MYNLKAISIRFRTISGKEYIRYRDTLKDLQFETEEAALVHYENEVEGSLAIGKWWTFASLPADAEAYSYKDRNKVGQRDRVWSKHIESYSVTLVQETSKAKAI